MQKNPVKQLAAGAASGIASRLAQALLAPISLGIAARSLSPEGLASYASLFSIAMIGSIPVSFASSSMLARSTAREAPEIWATAARVSVICFLSSIALVCGAAIADAPVLAAAAVAALITLSPLASISRGHLLSTSNAKRLSAAGLTQPVAMLGLFAVASNWMSFSLFLLASAATSFLVICVALGKSGLKILRGAMSQPAYLRVFRTGLLLAAPSGALLFIQRSDVTLLGLVGDQASAGDYLVTLQVLEVPLTLLGAALVFLVPTLRDLDGQKRGGLVIRLLLGFAAVAAALTGIASLFADAATQLILGRAATTLSAAPFVAGSAVLAVSYSVLSAFAVAIKKDMTAAGAAMAGSVLNLVLNLLFIPRFDAEGAAAATACTYLFLVSVLLLATLRTTLSGRRLTMIFLAIFSFSGLSFAVAAASI